MTDIQNAGKKQKFLFPKVKKVSNFSGYLLNLYLTMYFYNTISVSIV